MNDSVIQVIVRSHGGRGRSTVAALVAKTLRAHGIPVRLSDGEADPGDASAMLATESGGARLNRNLASISARETLAKGWVGVSTQQIQHEPKVRVPENVISTPPIPCPTKKRRTKT